MGSVAEQVGDALDDAWTTVTDEVTRWGEDISAEWHRMDPALQMAAIAIATWGAGTYLAASGYFAEGAAAAAATEGAATTAAAGSTASVAGATEAAAASMFEGASLAGTSASTAAEGYALTAQGATAGQAATSAGLASSSTLGTTTTVGSEFLVEGVGSSVGSGLAGGEAITVEATGGGLAATQSGTTIATSAGGLEVPWETLAKSAVEYGIPLLMGSAMRGGSGGSSSKISNLASAQASAVSGMGSGTAITEEQRKYAAPIVESIEKQKQKYSLLGGGR